MAIERAGAVIDSWLDQIFDEPLDVPDSETAIEMLTADPSSSMFSAAGAVAVTALLTRWLGRARFASAAGSTAASGTGPFGWAAKAGTVVLAVGVGRIENAVTAGMRDLRVLASYLIGRSRRSGIELDKQTVRSLTVSIYVDETRNLDKRRVGPKAGAAAAAVMLTQAANPMDARTRRRLAENRIRVIDQLDLAQFGGS